MILLVSGTGTDVGKTVATAALAVCATGTVAVVKPAQTGVRPGEPGDLAEVTRLSGRTDVHEFARYPDPLSPHHAALRSRLPALSRDEVAQRIADLDRTHDVVLVEGAGGLLVPFDSDDEWTMCDLAQDLDAPVLVVTAAGLGTLNHPFLTVAVLAERSVDVAGIVVGSWADPPGLAERYNIVDLARCAPRRELAGVLPAGMSAMADFPGRARAAIGPSLGGSFDWPAFRNAVRP
jgi:dethiobiotin synthetase